MNMGKVGIATAQMSQLGKTALQMKGISFRMLEALVKGNLTAAERRRLFIGHLLLTGVEGTIGSPRLAYNFYDAITNAGVPDEVALAVQEGLLNTLSRNVSDTPINFSEIFSPKYGQVFSDLWEQITTGPLTYIAGSSATGKTWDTLSTLANLGVKTVFGKASLASARYELEMLAARKSLPSSWNRAYAGVQAMIEGRKINAAGKLIASDVDALGAVMTMTGFETLQEKDIYEVMSRYSDYKNRINNAYEDIKLQWLDFCKDPTNETRANLYFNHAKNTFANYNLSDSDIAEVYKKANKDAKDVNPNALGRMLPLLWKMNGAQRAEEIYESRQQRRY